MIVKSTVVVSNELEVTIREEELIELVRQKLAIPEGSRYDFSVLLTDGSRVPVTQIDLDATWSTKETQPRVDEAGPQPGAQARCRVSGCNDEQRAAGYCHYHLQMGAGTGAFKG